MIDPRSLQQQQRPTIEPPVSLEDLRLVQLVDLACEIEQRLAVQLLGMIWSGSDEDEEESTG